MGRRRGEYSSIPMVPAIQMVTPRISGVVNAAVSAVIIRCNRSQEGLVEVRINVSEKAPAIHSKNTRSARSICRSEVMATRMAQKHAAAEHERHYQQKVQLPDLHGKEPGDSAHADSYQQGAEWMEVNDH